MEHALNPRLFLLVSPVYMEHALNPRLFLLVSPAYMEHALNPRLFLLVSPVAVAGWAFASIVVLDGYPSISQAGTITCGCMKTDGDCHSRTLRSFPSCWFANREHA